MVVPYIVALLGSTVSSNDLEQMRDIFLSAKLNGNYFEGIRLEEMVKVDELWLNSILLIGREWLQNFFLFNYLSDGSKQGPDEW